MCIYPYVYMYVLYSLEHSNVIFHSAFGHLKTQLETHRGAKILRRILFVRHFSCCDTVIHDDQALEQLTDQLNLPM